MTPHASILYYDIMLPYYAMIVMGEDDLSVRRTLHVQLTSTGRQFANQEQVSIGIQCGAVITRSIFTQILTRHPIAHPWGRAMGCLLWIKPLMHILSHSLFCQQQNYVMLHSVITALDYMCTHAQTHTHMFVSIPIETGSSFANYIYIYIYIAQSLSIIFPRKLFHSEITS